VSVRDDLGEPLACAGPPRRVVSLVPSLTEAVAVSAAELLVGATDYCVHPPGLDVERVGGSKYPSVERILALRPDLVLVNVEENRREDIAALRAAGVAVWVTYPRTVDEALDSLRRMCAALGLGTPSWWTAAREAWSAPFSWRYAEQAVIPVWRRPWVVLGSPTFAGDMLARLGVRNAYAGSPERYPRPTLDEIRAARPDLVVLPDEPYAFTSDDGPEAFPGIPCALVSGRHLTWYGPSLAEARDLLAHQLSAGPGAVTVRA
jgi:ABC-type Fe3+-hydroxamate transport system substrate-binding protein